MNVLIYYFSGTGNTEKVARVYKSAFENEGHNVTLISLPMSDEETKAVNPRDYDLIGVGYPIHAFNAPANILKLAKLMPEISENEDNKKAFVFKTSGEPVRMSDISSLKLNSILRKRGYIVTNEYQYVMPYNIIFRHSDQMVHKMWTTAQEVIPIDVREIISGNTSSPKKMFLGSHIARALRIEHKGARINGKFYKVNDKCVNCNLCVKTCPAENIEVHDGKIVFLNKCLMCMRCSFNCPVSAIDIGLFKGWKVNGAYSFKEPSPDSPMPSKKHANYCKKAYDRYFSIAEAKIAAANKKTETQNSAKTEEE